MKINVRIDVSPTAPFDKLAQEQSVENLLAAGHITFEEYVELLSEGSAMPKQKLLDLLAERQRQIEAQARDQAAQTAPVMPDMSSAPTDTAQIMSMEQAMPVAQIPTDGLPVMG